MTVAVHIMTEPVEVGFCIDALDSQPQLNANASGES